MYVFKYQVNAYLYLANIDCCQTETMKIYFLKCT